MKAQAPKPRHIPVRTCIMCRKTDGKRTLNRIVRTSAGVELDPGGKKPGRGAYLCAEPNCWQSALARNQIGRALRCELSNADFERLEEHMKKLAPTAPAIK